ncbi:hypothetical protein BDZ85DRAFT_263932 [Elsinoe ampelina]|uniref:Uncharacterized protein n=1 Tax=Elsinoe ampelina TaxID=302913 RepID=A0A6A6GAM6_9PEZI|nr:hypothetical protein BDZ85DRAFT_263932 [Elsinoe ampelina]
MSVTDVGSQSGDEPPPPYSGMASRAGTMRSGMHSQRRPLHVTNLNRRDIGSVRSVQTMQTNATMDSTTAAALTADGFRPAGLGAHTEEEEEANMPAELDAKSTKVDISDNSRNSISSANYDGENAVIADGMPRGISELDGSARPISELEADVPVDRQRYSFSNSVSADQKGGS